MRQHEDEVSMAVLALARRYARSRRLEVPLSTVSCSVTLRLLSRQRMFSSFGCVMDAVRPLGWGKMDHRANRTRPGSSLKALASGSSSVASVSLCCRASATR